MADLESPLNEVNKDDEQKNIEEDEIVKKKYKWYNVNTYSLPAKSAYFFETARRISYTPPLVLFLTGIGLNESESGKILGFR